MIAMPLDHAQSQQVGCDQPGGGKFRAESKGGCWALPELVADMRTKCSRELISVGDGAGRVQLAGYETVIAMLYEAEGRLRVMGPPDSSDPQAAMEKEFFVSKGNSERWTLDHLLAHVCTEFERQLQGLVGPDPKVRDRVLGYEQVLAAMWEAERRYRTLGSHRSRG